MNNNSRFFLFALFIVLVVALSLTATSSTGYAADLQKATPTTIATTTWDEEYAQLQSRATQSAVNMQATQAAFEQEQGQDTTEYAPVDELATAPKNRPLFSSKSLVFIVFGAVAFSFMAAIIGSTLYRLKAANS